MELVPKSELEAAQYAGMAHLVQQHPTQSERSFRSKGEMSSDKKQAADREALQNYWLSNRLIEKEMIRIYGNHSNPVRTMHWLHSEVVQWTLIALLLCDTLFVIFELFIESEYPACNIVMRDAISCCAADSASGEGSLDHVSHAMNCETGFLPSAGRAGCDEHKHAWTHVLHEMLTALSVFILGIFQAELIALIAALGRFFFRSKLYILDFLIITFSFGIHIYIYLIEWIEWVSPVDTDRLKDLQSLILLARAWRVVRVAHSIAASMQEMVAKSHHEIHADVEQLRKALHTLELEVEEKANFEIDDELKGPYEVIESIEKKLNI